MRGIFCCLLQLKIGKGGIIIIKPWSIWDWPFYSGYFELLGCGVIGQAQVAAIAVAISLTAPFCIEKHDAVFTLICSPVWMAVVVTVKLEYILFGWILALTKPINIHVCLNQKCTSNLIYMSQFQAVQTEFTIFYFEKHKLKLNYNKLHTLLRTFL